MKAYLLLLLSAALIWGCDTDRFTGFKYEADPLQTFARVEGKVVNIFDEAEPVAQATLFFEGQVDSTDFSGNYAIDFVLSSDALQDRPISLRISQDRYFDLDTMIVIRGDVSNINWRMTYGAPRVLSSIRTLPTFRAEILDYQGINSISSVQAIVTYRDFTDRLNYDTPFPMTRIQQVDANRAIYEVAVPDSFFLNNGNTAELLPDAPWSIQATDVDGFIETTKFF